ncbi:MAG: anaerobic glycerol-3-phosphate dehydrogenase subunit C [Chloroflexi bacterium]|nr:anaerobic glycerol-3-phosphate dehydrogenase subunit C [Chloroflexota bacterium]
MNSKIWEAQLNIGSHSHKLAELTLDQCIKCNICVTACPVTAVTDLFPGPKYEGPQAGRFRHDGQPAPDHSVDYCNGCRVCNMVCPSGVRIAEMNGRARSRIVQSGEVPWRHRLRNNLIARPELLGKLGQPVAPLANILLHSGFGRFFANLLFDIAPNAPLPEFSRKRFSKWAKNRSGAVQSSRKVVYFHGCSTEYYEARVGQAAVQTLEANGFEVLIPPQNCCGLPLLSNGEFGAAQAFHESNIRQLIDCVKQGYVIVGTSTSCTLTLKEEAPELLSYYTDEANLLAANTFDIHEFLALLLDAGDLKTEGLRPIPMTLAYHSPCQYRAHRIGRPSMEIMDLIPELTIVESQAACCGVGGTYGYKAEKYDIAMAVGRPLFDFVRKLNGPLAVCDSETCRWQIAAATGIPLIHPIELLAAAYGYPAEAPLASALNNGQ